MQQLIRKWIDQRDDSSTRDTIDEFSGILVVVRFNHVRFAEKNIKEGCILKCIQLFDRQGIDIITVILLKRCVRVHIKAELCSG
ncbi:hypothetical protein D3C75_1008470 [compost metagenome]